MNYQIRHRDSDAVLFELECDSLRACVETAVKARTNLADACLAGANLADANLTGAYLARTDLRSAYLTGANLTGANLTGANLAAQLGYPNSWPAWTYVAKDGGQRIRVGCHDFTVAEGRAYWAGKDYRREVLAALDYAEAIGRVRGWIK